MSGRRSSITSSCRGGRGRKRRGRGRRSIWRAGRGSGMTAKVTPLGITTTTKTTEANLVLGEAAEEGPAAPTNRKGPAPCWPTITWWSWSRSSRCRVSSPQAEPAPLSRPPAASPSYPASSASSSSSLPRTRRKEQPPPPVLQPALTPPHQQHHLHRHHHQVAALRSVLSHPARPSTLENCLTLGNPKEERVRTGLRRPDLETDCQKDKPPGPTWTAFPTRSLHHRERDPRTDTLRTRTQPVLKSSGSEGEETTYQPELMCFTVRKRPGVPFSASVIHEGRYWEQTGKDESDERWLLLWSAFLQRDKNNLALYDRRKPFCHDRLKHAH